MTEHCCGPTPAQVRDANMRGEVLGTWERCPECSERERLLWERIGPHVFIVSPASILAPEVPKDWPKPVITGI